MSDSVAPQGQASAPVTGKGSPAPASKTAPSQVAPSAAGQANGPFHKFTDPDGKEMVFNTADDLDKAFKESFFRQKDYTSKTMRHADDVKKFQKERESHEAEYKQILKQKEEIEKMNTVLRTRPDIQKLVTEAANRPIGPQGVFDRAQQYADEKYETLSKKLEGFEEWKKQQELESQRSSIYGRMKELDPEFDPNAVNEILEELSSGDMEPLIKILWDAKRGRGLPAKVEAKIKKSLEEKKGAGMIPGSGGPGANKSYVTPREAAEAAKRDMSIDET